MKQNVPFIAIYTPVLQAIPRKQEAPKNFLTLVLL